MHDVMPATWSVFVLTAKESKDVQFSILNHLRGVAVSR